MKKPNKETYLGKVKEHDIKPDLNKLKSLVHEDSVANLFCSLCGITLEVTAIGAQNLMKHGGLKCEDFTGKYIETTGCIICQKLDPKDVKVRIIDL